MAKKAQDEGAQSRKTCALCGISFASMGHLNQHMRSHSGERPYQCKFPHCNKAYTRREHLNRHIASFHSSERPYRCDVEGCNAAFSTREDLQRHTKSHRDELKCRWCGKTYIRKKALEAHEATHTNNPKPFACLECGIVLKDEADFKVHVRSHHCSRQDSETQPDVNNKFKCKVCGKLLSSKESLRKHRKLHSQDPSVFVCSYPDCGRSYNRMSNLRAHIRACHLSSRPHRCPICAVEFGFKSSLDRHLKLIHQKNPKGSGQALEDIAVEPFSGIPKAAINMTNF